VRGEARSTRLLITWDATNRYGNLKPVRMNIEQLGEDGRPTPAAKTIETQRGAEPASIATFDLKPGQTTLRFTVIGADGGVIDQWPERIAVPVLSADLALATPRFLRARTAFELRALETNPNPTPAAARRLRLTDRVLVEVECYSLDGAPVDLTAELLNQEGKVLVGLPVPALKDGKTRIALPLTSLARSTYVLRIQAKSGKLEARQLASFEIVP
jgi:hypothetical protein